MKLLCVLLGALFMFLAVFGGIGAFLSVFSYSIYMIILLVKGTVAVSFFSILKIVGCWILAPITGWITFLVLGFFGGVFIAAAK